LLFDSNDHRSIANALIRALENKNLRERAAGLNQVIISAKAEYKSNMAKVEKFYGAIAGKRVNK
jgi:hypothetical protein